MPETYENLQRVPEPLKDQIQQLIDEPSSAEVVKAPVLEDFLDVEVPQTQEKEEVPEMSEKELTIWVYANMEERNFLERYGYQMSGKQKRQVRRKLVALYDKGKLKLPKLNE